MTVRVFEWTDTIRRNDLGLELKDRAGRSRLSARLSQLLRGTLTPRVSPNPTNLQFYIDIYGEQVTADAVADLEKYVLYRVQMGYTLGGLATGLSPLAILPRDVRPSNTAISVLGEGLVGWFLEQRFQPLARPIGDGPDFVFEDTRGLGARTVLVEVKATQLSDVRGQMREAAVPALDYSLKVSLSGRNVSCLIAGVIIKSGVDFDLLILEIELL